MKGFILICGPSRAGKTTLTRALAERVNGFALHLDDVLLGAENMLTVIQTVGKIARKIEEQENKLVIADCLFFKKEHRDALGADKVFALETGNMNKFEYTDVHVVKQEGIEERVNEVLSNLKKDF